MIRVWWKCSIAVSYVQSLRGCGVTGGREIFPSVRRSRVMAWGAERAPAVRYGG